MKRNRLMFLLGAGVAVFALLACDAGDFVALVSPSPTPTRTPRPTFTPRPSVTPTPEDTATPEPTQTRVPPTPTLRVAPTARPATPKPPTAPPAPQFPWKQSSNLSVQGWCDAGPGVYEVKGRIVEGGQYAGGVHIVALDKDGKVVAQMDSLYREQMNLEWGVNCREEKNLSSYQLDISAGRASGPITLRITQSARDLTPISTDIRFDLVANGGRWYYDWEK